jgi:large-conductance mechanosensitive channel
MASLIISFILLATEIFIATKTINRNLIKTESIISKYR